MSQWFNTKGGALINADTVASIYEEDGKVYAEIKREDGIDIDDVPLAVESLMALRMALKMKAVVI